MADILLLKINNLKKNYYNSSAAVFVFLMLCQNTKHPLSLQSAIV